MTVLVTIIAFSIIVIIIIIIFLSYSSSSSSAGHGSREHWALDTELWMTPRKALDMRAASTLR